MAGIDHYRIFDLAPVRVLDSINAQYQVAALYASHFPSRASSNSVHDRLIIDIGIRFVMHHCEDGRYGYRRQYVHYRPCDREQSRCHFGLD